MKFKNERIKKVLIKKRTDPIDGGKNQTQLFHFNIKVTFSRQILNFIRQKMFMKAFNY